MSTRWWSFVLALGAAVLVGVLILPASFGQFEEPSGGKEAAKEVQAADLSPFGSGAAPGGGKAVAAETRKESAKPEAPPIPARQRIEAALEEIADLDFVEMPLNDVVAYLADLHKIPIQIDRKSLDASGIGTDTPVTRQLEGIWLRSALDLMLRDLELTWTIRDEVLLVTTPEAAGQMLETKVCDVADLVVFEDEKGRWEDFDTLVETITKTVCPESWADTTGGPARIRGAHLGEANVLVVAQTYDAHRQIARLLEEIRQVSRKGTAPADPPRRPRPSPVTGGAMSGRGGGTSSQRSPGPPATGGMGGWMGGMMGGPGGR